MNNVFRRLVALLVFLGLQAIALEVSLWAFFRLHQDYDAEMWRYTQLLKQNVPDERGHIHRANGSAKLMGVGLATDGLGLRAAARSSIPEPGPRELLVVGDSFTLGWGVEASEAYPALLDRCASAHNAGVGNYN